MTHVIPSVGYGLTHGRARPWLQATHDVAHRLTLDRLAFATLALLALSLGLGDIAQVTPVDSVLLNGVHALVPLAIGLAALSALADQRWPRFPRQVTLPLAAWLLVLLLSALLASTNRAEALAALQRPAAGALLAWSIYAVCTTRSRWLRTARAVALGGLAIAFVGLAEAMGAPPIQAWLASLHDGQIPIGDVPRLASTLSHPNVAAILLELSLPLLIAWMWTAARSWQRGLLACGALGSLLAMVLTFSRAGIVAGLVGLTVMAGMSLAHGERRRLLTLGFVALAVPAALMYAVTTAPGLDRRLTAELVPSTPPQSTAHAQPPRSVYWLVALDMLRDNPWLGVGPDNYRWRFASYSGLAQDNLGVHAHNQYIEALADTGVLGLLTLAWLFLALVRTAADGVRFIPAPAGLVSREDWPWRAAMLASLSAWLVHALLDDFERFWPASVAFWLIAGLVQNTQRLKSQKTAPTTTTRTSRTRIPPGLASAAPPPPPPPKLTITRIVRRRVTPKQDVIRGSR